MHRTTLPYSINYGNGAISETRSVCDIGTKLALVDPNSCDSYFAVNDMLGGSNKVEFSIDSASVSNDVVGKSVDMIRCQDDMWRLSFDDLKAVTQWPFDEALNATTIINARVHKVPLPRFKRKRMLLRLIKIHKRMGHPPVEIMRKAIKYGHWTNTGIDVDLIRSLWSEYDCISCTMAKTNAIPISVPSDVRVVTPGSVISCDPVPVSIPGVFGEIWIFLFKDIATGYWHEYSGKSKTEFVENLIDVIKWYKKQDHTCLILRTDSEWVLTSADVAKVLDDYDMTSQRSTPYHHYQNSVERDVQTMIKQISTLLHDQSLLKASFWNLVLAHIVKCHNRIPNHATGNETPRSKVMKNPMLRYTNLSNTFMFYIGELVAVGIKKEHRTWKFDTKRELGIYVGQPEGCVDGHLIYFPYERVVHTRGDVISLGITPAQIATFYATRAGILKSRPSCYAELKALASGLGIDTDDTEPPAIQPMEITHVPLPPPRMATRNRPADVVHSVAVPGDNSRYTIEVPQSQLDNSNQHLFDRLEHFLDKCWCACEGVTRIPDSMERNVRFAIPTPGSQNFLFNHHQDDVPLESLVNARRVHNSENPSPGTALNGEERPHWVKAIRSEVLDNLLKIGNVSLELVDQLPLDALLYWITFVLKKKIKPGREDRYKARGCFMGNMLPKDFAETYSPTVSSVTWALLQQVALIDEMNQALVDTVGAFLAQYFSDSMPPLYVKFDKKIAKVCDLNPNQVYRVRRYIYGIPDAGRAYYKAYSGLLVSQGYKQSEFDPCLFYKCGSNVAVFAWIHVDDTWVAACSQQLLDMFVTDVETKFEVTQEPVDNYLGVHYETLSDGSVKKTQPKLINDLFAKHSITNKPLVRTPAVTGATVPRDDTPYDSTLFLCLLGTLLYVLFSRPDIGFAVSWAATKANQPTVSDFKDLMRVVQYLYQTKDKGLILKKQVKGCPLVLYIYVDASYLLYPDSKAQTGYSLSINDIGTFYSKSQKQSLVTTSSTHSEMRALFVVVCEYVFIMHLLEEIGRPLTFPAIVYEDNQPVVTLLNRERAMPKASKHFAMLVNYVRELVVHGLIEVRKVLTSENYADIFTKHV